MPPRRRPSEPSARVRALLESTDSRRAPALSEAGRPTGEVVPWLPERSWVEASAAPSQERSTHPARPGRHRRPLPPGPRFLTVPVSLRGARLSGPRAAAAGLLLVVLLAAVGFGARVAWARAA